MRGGRRSQAPQVRNMETGRAQASNALNAMRNGLSQNGYGTKTGYIKTYLKIYCLFFIFLYFAHYIYILLILYTPKRQTNYMDQKQGLTIYIHLRTKTQV